MTDPTPEPDPQPQPVTDFAKQLGKLVGAAVVAVGGVWTLIAAEGITSTNLAAVGLGIGGAVTAVVAVLLAVWAYLGGKSVREQVTPVSSPRSAKGEPLLTAAEWTARSQADIRDFAERMNARFEQWRDELSDPDKTQELPAVTPEIPAKTDEPTRQIPEQVIPGRRLGRHVHHDPRSLSYLIPPTTTPVTAMWTRRVPVFDQGDLGSCTGNAAAGVLGTDPFYATLPKGFKDDEVEAVLLYSDATNLDDYDGAYPPDDTGSDGLSVAKACQKAGLISGYQHITSVAAAQTAIVSGPFIVGVNWYTSMDNPDANGLVKVSGSIRGGHEFECHGYDAAADLWWFTNSWGTLWGKNGTFCMSSASLARLLSEQGDATVFLPVVPAPAPQPPAPTPGPAADTVAVPAALAAGVTGWAKRAIRRKDDSHADKDVAREWIAEVTS